MSSINIDKDYENTITDFFKKINFNEVLNIDLVKNELIQFCDNFHVGTNQYTIKVDISEIIPYLKDTDFIPIISYFGRNIKSIHYGKLILYAITNNSLYKIIFRTKSIRGNSSLANRIDSIKRQRVFINNQNKVILHEVNTDSYGFGALWCPCPDVETTEQINLYNLQKSLKNWSVSNKVNEKLRKEARCK